MTVMTTCTATGEKVFFSSGDGTMFLIWPAGAPEGSDALGLFTEAEAAARVRCTVNELYAAAHDERPVNGYRVERDW